MSIATGTVVDGKIVVEGLTLPEGTVVTVLAPDDQAPIRLPPNLEQELLAAIDEADAEPGGAGPEFLESLRRYG
ncbi:hypothetical protein [Pseudorhodoferax sp. Leaf267]|uniref:hypothetical protein n=1 Tax=Pseudorhodoferax sp. Leaf267 TaxID=1736316 RepID=UPI0006FFB56F|nr:hypothetical protein [Pseudorhodoferax sp. Leaf267]KQP23494.1 hypothetical protein ASF43_06465 [Pseudorhodoferax sp. Leaf267]